MLRRRDRDRPSFPAPGYTDAPTRYQQISDMPRYSSNYPVDVKYKELEEQSMSPPSQPQFELVPNDIDGVIETYQWQKYGTNPYIPTYYELERDLQSSEVDANPKVPEIN